MKQRATPLPCTWSRNIAVIAVALTLGACSTMGVGSGSLKPGNTPASFTWNSKDGGVTGHMSATLVNEGVFDGPFMQITSTTRTEVLEPLWTGWRRGWGDWGYRGSLPAEAFTTTYSGQVVANLTGPNQQSMRCRFTLNAPSEGMRGGGQGECQFGGGRTVSAVFANS